MILIVVDVLESVFNDLAKEKKRFVEDETDDDTNYS